MSYKWPNKWTQNGWLNVHGQTISNYDLVTKNYELYEWINDEYDDRGWGELDLIHVKGHSGNDGNEEADNLANLAADRYGYQSSSSSSGSYY